MGNLAIQALRTWYGLKKPSLEQVLGEIRGLKGELLETAVARRLHRLSSMVMFDEVMEEAGPLNLEPYQNWSRAAYTRAYREGEEAAKAPTSRWDDFYSRHRAFSCKVDLQLEDAVLTAEGIASMPPSEAAVPVRGIPQQVIKRGMEAALLATISELEKSTFTNLMDYAYLAGAGSVFEQKGHFILAAHAYAGMRYAKSALKQANIGLSGLVGW